MGDYYTDIIEWIVYRLLKVTEDGKSSGIERESDIACTFDELENVLKLNYNALNVILYSVSADVPIYATLILPERALSLMIIDTGIRKGEEVVDAFNEDGTPKVYHINRKAAEHSSDATHPVNELNFGKRKKQ